MSSSQTHSHPQGKQCDHANAQDHTHNNGKFRKGKTPKTTIPCHLKVLQTEQALKGLEQGQCQKICLNQERTGQFL